MMNLIRFSRPLFFALVPFRMPTNAKPFALCFVRIMQNDTASPLHHTPIPMSRLDYKCVLHGDATTPTTAKKKKKNAAVRNCATKVFRSLSADCPICVGIVYNENDIIDGDILSDFMWIHKSKYERGLNL